MRLSDFTDEKAIQVVGDLLVPIGKIAGNPEIAAAHKGTVIEFVAAICRNNPKEVKDMLAILADVKPEEYRCTAASVMADALNMLNDSALLELFGLQSKTPPSSGSASENIEGR